MKRSSILTLLVALLSVALIGLFITNLQSAPSEVKHEAAHQSQTIVKQALQTKKPVDNSVGNKGRDLIFPVRKNKESPLGINTNEVFEQDASIPFVDLFRVATPFHENIRCRAKDQPCLTSAEVEYDKQGWPKRLNGGKAGVFFLRNIPIAALPQGDYTVLYDGDGRIEYLQNVEVVSREKGEDIIRFTARSDNFMTAALQITKSNDTNPLKNIRIIMPGGVCQNAPFQQINNEDTCTDSTYLDFKTHHASIIFNPDYLNFMKDFSVIRFMPMSGITRNPAEHWEQRPMMDKATWGGIYGSRGAPLEIQIALANRLKADPWLNVPHAADDEYMYNFASYVRQHLSPELRPHIEYTNEAWNSNFVHNEHMQKMGIAQKLDQDALMAGYKYYSKRSVEFFNIWEKVYGGHKRFVRIMGGWDTRPDISGILLAYNKTYESVDALAIAPYVGGNLRGFRAAKTVDDIFELLTDEKSYRSLPNVIKEIKKQAELANSFGVRLIAYEGGQGLVDWAAKDYTQHPNPLFFAANRDSRMGDLYADMYQQWRDLGADLFVAFSAPRSCNWSGCWGLKEHIRQDKSDAPKLKASLKFSCDNKRWWDWSEQKEKPDESKVAHYLPSLDSDKPRIVIRPAKGDPEKFYRFENPQSLHILVEGETWDKRDISGKWQVKWDENNIYLSVKVYDKEIMVDSDDPTQDDSIEFFIDGDNSRDDSFDKKNDFHFIFARNKTQVFFGEENPEDLKLDIPFEMENKYDGYELRAEISWSQLGLSPKIADKISMDVVVNDDDDGGNRDARVSWNTRKVETKPKDFGMILVSGR
ncbi:MAG: sugar-binding protein [Thiotrichaceae bacterium]